VRQHQDTDGVKRKQNALETPGFMRFLQPPAQIRKKTATEYGFEHACCIHPHIASKRPLEVAALRQIKKTAAGLPDGVSDVSPGTLFSDAKALKNSAEVVCPLASRL